MKLETIVILLESINSSLKTSEKKDNSIQNVQTAEQQLPTFLLSSSPCQWWKLTHSLAETSLFSNCYQLLVPLTWSINTNIDADGVRWGLLRKSVNISDDTFRSNSVWPTTSCREWACQIAWCRPYLSGTSAHKHQERQQRKYRKVNSDIKEIT